MDKQTPAIATALTNAKSHRARRKANKKARVQSYEEGGTVASGESADTVALIIIDEFSKQGLDGYFAVQVAQAESGLNPNATGDGGRSHGLFQLYDGGLLQDFYAKGYTDPNDARQAARYTAGYVKANHDWGPWHSARAIYQSGGRPSDGSGYHDGTYNYDGGGGSPSQPVGSSEPPASSSSNPATWSRDEWAFAAAAQMGAPQYVHPQAVAAPVNAGYLVTGPQVCVMF